MKKRITHLLIAAKNMVLRSKKRKILTITCGILVTGIVLFVTLRPSYSLNAEVTHSIYAIPDNASMYLEIMSPTDLHNSYSNSSFGKEMSSSKAWQRLTITPEFQKLSNLLYYLELKAGNIIDLSDLPSFFGGSVGYAKMPDNSILIVAKTNTKSKLGLALISAFKGESVPIEQKSRNDESAAKLEGVTADSYKEVFGEEKVDLANLTATKISSSSGSFYLVMMGDFLFISDSEDTLRDSLVTAGKASSAGLAHLSGMKEALELYKKSGDILLYSNSSTSSAAPLCAALLPGGSGAAAAVLFAKDTAPLSGSIFAIEYSPEKKSSPEKGIEWEKTIPRDNVCAFYSTNDGINDEIEKMKSLAGSWSSFSESANLFFDDAGIARNEYFGESKGTALILMSADLSNQRLYPQFAFGYTSKIHDSAVLKAVFKGKETVTQNFQNTSYTSLQTIKGNFYTPSFLYSSAGIITSGKSAMEKFISASKGNQPVIGDDSSYTELGEYKNAPAHLVLSIPRMITSLRTFFLYGAARSGDYTSITVDRDITPLSAPFKRYETLHIASGLNRIETGKIILTEANAGAVNK